MITLEALKRHLDELIEAKEPFIAYRYPRGFGVLRTGPVRITREVWIVSDGAREKRYHTQDGAMFAAERIRLAGRHPIIDRRSEPGPLKPVSEGVIKRWRRQLDRLPPFDLLVVEFDGEHITTNGGINPWQN